MQKYSDDPFQMLIGTELSSVEFVRDYIQLRFDGPRLTILTNPVLEILNDEYTRTRFGFCDVLCRFIGDQVEETSLNEEQVVQRFKTNQKIKISLKTSDRKTEEAVLFDADDGKWWSW